MKLGESLLNACIIHDMFMHVLHVITIGRNPNAIGRDKYSNLAAESTVKRTLCVTLAVYTPLDVWYRLGNFINTCGSFYTF